MTDEVPPHAEGSARSGAPAVAGRAGGTEATKVSLAALTKYFLRLGAFGFGGPIALTAAMQRDLVLSRRWVTVEEYKEGLALAQLAPGPLAAQLAMYIGWARWGPVGATVAGLGGSWSHWQTARASRSGTTLVAGSYRWARLAGTSASTCSTGSWQVTPSAAFSLARR
jgi:hypothetical protein